MTATPLDPSQTAAVKVLYETGRTAPQVAKLIDVDYDQVATAIRAQQLTPPTATATFLAAREIYTTSSHSCADIADQLAANGKKNTTRYQIGKWARDHAWPWGGTEDGTYTPAAAKPARPPLLVRNASGPSNAAVNSPDRVKNAAARAIEILELAIKDNTQLLVNQAVIAACGQCGVTDIATVRPRVKDHKRMPKLLDVRVNASTKTPRPRPDDNLDNADSQRATGSTPRPALRRLRTRIRIQPRTPPTQAQLLPRRRHMTIEIVEDDDGWFHVADHNGITISGPFPGEAEANEWVDGLDNDEFLRMSGRSA